MTGAFDGAAPDGWEQTTVGAIADVRLGRQRSPANHSGKRMRPYLRAANVDWFTLRLDDVKEMNFTDDEMVTYELRSGDVLVVEGSGSAGEVGKATLVGHGLAGHAFQNTLIRLRPRDGIDSKWLMYRINAEAALGGFSTLARGVGIFHLGARRLADWPIAVPPLDEQQAIVDMVERLRSRVEKGRSGLLALIGRIERLRAAQLAVNYDEAAASGGLLRLGELLEDIEAGKSFKCPGHPAANGKPGVLKLGAVTWGRFDASENKELPPDVTPDPRWRVRQGDLIVSRANTVEYVGASVLVQQTKQQLYLSDKTLRLVPVPGVDRRWIKAVLSAPQARRQMSALATGTSDSMRNISQAKLRSVQVPAQPKDLEHRLSRLEVLDSSRLHLRSEVQRCIELADSLHRALLRSAFRIESRPSDATTSAALLGVEALEEAVL